jgi:Fe-S cluster biosynthesis and repair protein YggX
VNQKQIAEMCKTHWKAYFPEAHAMLVQESRLEKEAQGSAKLTLAEMEALMLGGMDEKQAYSEASRLFVTTDPTK